MKQVILIVILLLFFSCTDKKKKIEFVQSKVTKSLFLIKNPPENDFLLKKEISLFLIKNHSKNKNEYKMFYKYSSNTKDFIENERPGGYFREYLDHYREDQFATFTIEQCEIDSTKLLGRLYFYGLKGSDDGQKEIDTLIYKCK
ncbi:hypothetical protein GCM10023210_21170 [Chryseobacterium ginsengisoli]|uniref:Lipoprotein n=1 Tax=Chryseobacterium ginsengisoli TaxID=363853 RepID=A0ABP9MBA8_9FLAO